MRCRSVVNDVPPRLKQTDLEIIFFFTNTYGHMMYLMEIISIEVMLTPLAWFNSY